MNTNSVGSKLFFPNLTIKLLRSNLPPHQAILQTPPQLTKLDIKQLMQKLYNVSIVDVRTMNYSAIPQKNTRKRQIPKFKKAIITMKEDFVFPEIPGVKDGAIKLPPRVSFGRNSARRIKKKIYEQAEEMGVSLDTKA